MYSLQGACLFLAGLAAVSASAAGHSYHSRRAPTGLVVQSPSGTFSGLIEGTAPNVRQFRSIPFAQPPVGDLRWAPPTKRPANSSSGVIDATRYPPSCPQFFGSSPSLWNTLVPEWLIYHAGQSTTSGAYANSSAEDCLYLGVWAPTGNRTNLPVIVFTTGGAFLSGGVDIAYQLPTEWVQRTQSHIVVTINYRVNIMGFPDSAALTDNNLGLLDQRAALEWTRDNIAAFGGDPTKITLWGQSAGSIATEFQSFIEPQDPIAQGYVMTSGTFGLGLTVDDPTHTHFTTVAQQVGCGNTTSAAEELTCMRKVPVRDLVTIGSNQSFAFFPVVDNRTVFSNYTDLYIQGKFSQKPAIYSNCANDGTASIAYPTDFANVNTTAEELATDSGFRCPAANSARLRSAFVESVYRYEFAGNFSNVSPAAWLGAYHDSDLAFIFGTHDDFRGPSTPYEYQVSHKLQDLVLAFMRNPKNVTGWPTVEQGSLLRIGAPGGPAVQAVALAEIDTGCQ